MDWTDRIGRRIKLRDLHILLAVAEHGSMAKASSRLSVSHPVVSKAILELERTLGVRLFDRGAQGVELTAHGAALLGCGVAVFDEMRQGLKRLEALSDPRPANCGSAVRRSRWPGWCRRLSTDFFRNIRAFVCMSLWRSHCANCASAASIC